MVGKDAAFLKILQYACWYEDNKKLFSTNLMSLNIPNVESSESDEPSSGNNLLVRVISLSNGVLRLEAGAGLALAIGTGDSGAGCARLLGYDPPKTLTPRR